MRIAVIGTGYVGLVAGACLAETGNQVICVDKDESKITKLRRGKIPIYEPGLEELVSRNKKEARLAFTTALDRAVRQSQIVFIAVGTPQGEDGSSAAKPRIPSAWSRPPSSSSRARRSRTSSSRIAW